MIKCPKCGSTNIHRSRSRSKLEQLRKSTTTARLHRCHDCGWRGWGEETVSFRESFDLPEGDTQEAGEVDLDALDLPVRRRAANQDEEPELP